RAVRMFDHVPQLWLKRDAVGPEFSARVNEFFPFQIGIWATRGNLKNVRVTFSEMQGDSGTTISELSCLQSQGVTWDGTPLARPLDVAEGDVLPLWCALDVDEDVRPGRYT